MNKPEPLTIDEQVIALRRALGGRHPDLYRRSVTFKRRVDSLADRLAGDIEAYAALGREEQRKLDAAYADAIQK